MSGLIWRANWLDDMSMCEYDYWMRNPLPQGWAIVRAPHVDGPLIHQVVLWRNGMVMAIDEKGNQLPEYQGPLREVGRLILRDAPEAAGYQLGKWGRGREHELKPIGRVAFSLLVWAGLLGKVLNDDLQMGEPSRQ